MCEYLDFRFKFDLGEQCLSFCLWNKLKINWIAAA